MLLPTPLIPDDQEKEHRECNIFFFLFKKSNQIVLWKHRRSVPFSLIFTDVGRTLGFLAYLDIIIFLAANWFEPLSFGSGSPKSLTVANLYRVLDSVHCFPSFFTCLISKSIVEKYSVFEQEEKTGTKTTTVLEYFANNEFIFYWELIIDLEASLCRLTGLVTAHT